MATSATRQARGGKRTQRAKRSAQNTEEMQRALALLESVKTSHLGEEYDEEGIWGISKPGLALVEDASKILGDLRGNPAAERADRALGHFFDEYNGWGYVTEDTEGFLDEALGELQAENL